MKYVSNATPSVIQSWCAEFPYERKMRRWTLSFVMRIFPERVDWNIVFELFTME